jgi:hypothetical protein
MKIVLFAILSLPILALSWRTLFSLKNHGLYRLVVWECILWLAIQNHRYLIVEEFVLSAVFIMGKKAE